MQLGVIESDTVSAPMSPITEERRAEIRATLRECGLLAAISV